ncbi:MAG: TolC family protein [Planctomycetes bacterium]|nr:TolC family protein [Planctomycetota bacterium]MCP4771350.1 TolC family protein [Planctomycetota bacterium]MCP4861787.1 TolC family protein [Planctomycetota bacterium]
MPCPNRRYLLPLFCLAVAACATPEEHRTAADEEVYSLLDERRAALFDRPAGFTADRNADALRFRLLNEETAGEALQLNLTTCLEIAAENNRSYQTRREQLYRSALDLTLERWRFGWRPSLSASGSVTGSGDDANNARVDGDFGLSKQFGNGAQIIGSIGTDLFRALSNGDGWDVIGSLGLTATMPLLRGSAQAMILEPLTQAERNLVYEVRTYERYRRTFAVDVVGRYYAILRTLDSITNEEANLESLKLLVARNVAFADAGRMNDIEVDQARQDLLRSEATLVNLMESYGGQMDQFMLLLGLPTETYAELDRSELEALKLLDGADLVGIDPDALMALSLERRLDLVTVRDRLIDAERRVAVAEDALRNGLDLEASVGSTSQEGKPLSFRSSTSPWSLGLDLDLSIDRLPERNIYRRSLLDRDSAVRSEEELSDTVLADMRDNLRQTRSTAERYQLQLISVTLAERRVRSSEMKQELGRTDTRTVLESRRSLLSAQNSATSALIDYALARLRLYRDLELLDVDPNGIQLDEASLPRLTAPVE